METCRHEVLTLVKTRGSKLRCRHCHLIITEDELGSGCCPECLETRRKSHRDFDKIIENKNKTSCYRCERCGMMVEA